MRPSSKTVRCIDWSRIIFDLEAAGLSIRDIAAGIGYRNHSRVGQDDGGKSWVHRLKNIPDTQPKFHEGAMLLGLWAEKMDRPMKDLPRSEYRYVKNKLGRITAIPLVDRALPIDVEAVTEIGADSQRVGGPQ